MSTKDSLGPFGRSDEIGISSRRPDGTLRPYVPIWGVVVGGALFVRSQAGPENGWYRRALAGGQGRVRAGGTELDVSIAKAGAPEQPAIDAAYRSKYGRYGDIGGIVGPALHDVTLRLEPTTEKDTTMQQRTLGRQGLTTSALGFGAMGISLAYGPGDEQTGVATIQKAHDLGVTFFDTAESYGWGENEKIVGRAVKGFRDDVVIATKFGLSYENGVYGVNSHPGHIREVVRNSLRNLGVDHIDVLYQHRIDPDVPIEDVAGTVKELIDAGTVRYFGLSEVGGATLRRAHAVQPVSVLQSEYSLFERDVEALFPVLDDLGVGLVAYSPLGRGFLTGTAKPAHEYDESDYRRTTDERWQPGNYEKNVEATRQLTDFAQTKGASVAQLALAWLLARGEHIVPIPGTRSPQRVAENIGAAGLNLTDQDLARIDEILPRGGFGARYPEGHLPVWE